MTEQEFLAHHRLGRNPFADEDAQTDAVFKSACIDTTLHPSWSKVFGDPLEPATAIVFGPKGSGKTAMKLQIAKHLDLHNASHAQRRVFVVNYDDFNRYLGPMQDHMPAWNRDSADRLLDAIQVWDHLDAVLCEGVSELVDRILEKENAPLSEAIRQTDVDRLDRGQRRDLLLLAACYDQSKLGSFRDRWNALRKRLQFANMSTWGDVFGGWAWTIVVGAIGGYVVGREALALRYAVWVIPLVILVGWLPFAVRALRCYWKASRVCKHVRVGRRDWGNLARVFMSIPMKELAGQPIPVSQRSDDRYALLEKFQMTLAALGFPGLIVIVDRVDEPDLVLGDDERMKKLIWPMLDNKFLKHPGLGLKLLLPGSLHRQIERESQQFHQRARLDKQNVISAVDWTGEALYDLANARMQACAAQGVPPKPSDLFDANVSEQRLMSAMSSLRTPRALFRFLYRVIANHCKQHRSSEPNFKISSETFESTLAVFQSELSRLVDG